MEGDEAIKPAGEFMVDVNVNVVDVHGLASRISHLVSRVACCFRAHFAKGMLARAGKTK